MQKKELEQIPQQRLSSLDFYRGLTMFVLIGGSTGLYELLQNSNNSFIASFGLQLEHHPWHGLTFWDLVEPFFMFIVGVAIPFATMNRLEKKESWRNILLHVLKRAIVLFFLGIIYHSISAGKPVFRLWNVLTQLSFTYLLAFLLLRKPVKVQITVSLLLLILSEILYRFWPIEGFNHAFIPDKNFGGWVDLQLMGVLENDHWVAFNAIPTAAFTIWGAIAGLILRGKRSHQKKIQILTIAGISGVFIGLALDPFTPIIKRIATSSYVIEAGGWCLLILALSYWIVDIKKLRAVPEFFIIVGTNSLFIYLFKQFGGASFLAHIIKPFSIALFFWSGETGIAYSSAIITWFLLWYLCYWLYKHKIFIKI